MAPAISVVIPAYREELRLPATLERVVGYLEARGCAFEVLVVDDGSPDRTADVARAYEARGVTLLRQPENRGKGAAVKRGVLASRGSLVLISDADLSTPIEDLERLEREIGEAPVVLGSRALASSEITCHQPFYREAMGKTFNWILRRLGLVRFRDTQCGFKLLAGEEARRLFAELTVERFAYDVELVLLAQAHGLAVREVGVRWADSAASRVNPLVDSARMLWDVLRLAMRRREHRRR